MIKSFIRKTNLFINYPNHHRHEINQELLYKNRVKKSVIILIFVILALSINIFCTIFYYQHFIKFGTINLVFTIFCILAILVGVKVLPYHLRNYGLNADHLKYNLIYGTIIGLTGLGFVILIRYLLCKYVNQDYGFNPAVIPTYFFYLPVPFIQELLFKGLFQSYFMAVFDNFKYKKIIAITIASYVFGLFHIILGWQLFFLTFLFSFITGFFYEKTRSIIGVSIIHLLCGAGIFYFSNIIIAELH